MNKTPSALRANPPPTSLADARGQLEEEPPQDGLRVVAVVSGKGGVGKTSIAANLAVAMAKRGRKVLLMDAALGLPNLDIILGLNKRHTLLDVVLGKVRLEDVLVEGPAGIAVLPAESGAYEMTCLDDRQRYAILEQIDALESRFDTVLIDNSAGINQDVQFFAGAAREVLVVTDREPTAITDASATIKILSQRRKNRVFRLLVNNVDTDTEAREVYRLLTMLSDSSLEGSITLLGSIPRDPNVAAAVMARRSIVELFPQSPASVRLLTLADKLLSLPLPEGDEGGMKMFWERIFRQAHASGSGGEP